MGKFSSGLSSQLATQFILSRKNGLTLATRVSCEDEGKRTRKLLQDHAFFWHTRDVRQIRASNLNLILQRDDRTAEADQEEVSGYTPLIYAAYYGYPELTAHLLSRGACPQMKEKDGYNAYTMARYYLEKELGTLAELHPQDKLYHHHQENIRRYQKVVDLLQPVVLDQTMPPKRVGGSGFNYYLGVQ